MVYDNAAWGGATPSFILPNTQGATMAQAIRGIYQSSPTTKYFKMTHIVGNGQPNANERVFINGTQVGGGTTFPDPTLQGPASDRGFTAATFDSQMFPNLMPGTTDPVDGFGETVTTSVDHTQLSPYECLSWSAIVFSTDVKDVEGDGVPDGIEDAIGGLTTDANGVPLPNLNAMGASSTHKDIFIEMDAMVTGPTSYGSTTAPFSATENIPTLTDAVGHNHMPSPATAKILIDTYRGAQLAVPNVDGSLGITPHLDVGNPASYIDGSRQRL